MQYVPSQRQCKSCHLPKRPATELIWLQVISFLSVSFDSLPPVTVEWHAHVGLRHVFNRFLKNTKGSRRKRSRKCALVSGQDWQSMKEQTENRSMVSRERHTLLMLWPMLDKPNHHQLRPGRAVRRSTSAIYAANWKAITNMS
jgi:hypothetical protein